jgi:signal transduction histidine kinase
LRRCSSSCWSRRAPDTAFTATRCTSSSPGRIPRSATPTLRIEGEPTPLPPALDLAAYRVLQEGLTNVRKHAAACRVEVVLRYGRDAIGVEVSDDGEGSGSGGGTGGGLLGIRERVALLGGEFVAGPCPHGFALRVTLPLA